MVGHLSFAPRNGTRVILVGKLASLGENWANPNLESFDAVLGRLEDGTECSLHFVREIPPLRVSGTEIRSTIDAQVLLLGIHVPNPHDLVLESVCLSLSYLEEWTRHRPFKRELDTYFNYRHGVPGDGFGQGVEYLAYRPAPIEEFEIPSAGARLKVVHWHNRQDRGQGYRSTLWTHTAGVLLQPDKPQPARWFWDVDRKLLAFFTVVLGHPVHALMISATVSCGIGFEGRSPEVTVFVSQPFASAPVEILDSDVLLSLPRIRSQLSAMLDNWFKKADVLDPAIHLLLGAFYNPSFFPDQGFLSLMQAIETFQRRTQANDDRFVPSADFKILKGRMLDGLPADVPLELREHLETHLKYLNKLDLRARLNLLFNRLGTELSTFILGDAETFLLRAKKARDFLTHYEPTSDPQKESLSQSEFDAAIPRLRFFLLALIWHEIGLDSNAILAALSSNPYSRFELGHPPDRSLLEELRLENSPSPGDDEESQSSEPAQ